MNDSLDPCHQSERKDDVQLVMMEQSYQNGLHPVHELLLQIVKDQVLVRAKADHSLRELFGSQTLLKPNVIMARLHVLDSHRIHCLLAQLMAD